MLLKTSESTVRRDFEELELKGILKRFHGGAEYSEKNKEELTFTSRMQFNKETKDNIAKYAASIVDEGDIIYLDAGSTVFGMIPYLKDKDVHVVTNGVTHIEELLSNNIKTTLIGGVIKTITSAIVGEEAETQLKNYFFDKAFIGINSISEANGFSTPEMREAAVKKIVVERAKEPYFLASSEKFDTNSFAHVASLNQAVVITNEHNKKYEKIMKIIVAK